MFLYFVFVSRCLNKKKKKMILSLVHLTARTIATVPPEAGKCVKKKKKKKMDPVVLLTFYNLTVSVF